MARNDNVIGLLHVSYRVELDRLWSMFVAACGHIEGRDIASSLDGPAQNYQRGERHAAKVIRRSVPHPRYDKANFPAYHAAPSEVLAEEERRLMLLATRESQGVDPEAVALATVDEKAVNEAIYEIMQEGMASRRDTTARNPYPANTVKYFLHLHGWLLEDLRIALIKASPSYAFTQHDAENFLPVKQAPAIDWRAVAIKRRDALIQLMRAVCGETGFARAVRTDSGKAYPWPALDEAEKMAREAMAPAPRTEPVSYTLPPVEMKRGTDMILVSRETLRLARLSLEAAQEREAYHNRGEALDEIKKALARPVAEAGSAPTREELAAAQRKAAIAASREGMHQAEIRKLRAHLEVAREALIDTEENLRMSEHLPTIDPKCQEEVKQLGHRHGYGAIMSTASALWRELLQEGYSIRGGELVVGVCRSAHNSMLAKVRDAIKKLEV